MMPHRQSVIGGEKDPRIFCLARLIQGLQDPADLGIHVGDDRIIFLPMNFYGFLRAGGMVRVFRHEGQHHNLCHLCRDILEGNSPEG